MKAILAGLLDSVGNTYDQTRTTIQGRVTQKTINSQQVLGPPLNSFVDVTTDSGITAITSVLASPNGRIFTTSAEALGIVTISLHELNFQTGATVYVGRININMPDTAATTTAFRSLKAYDVGTTGWKICLSTTGSVLINGGTFIINNIDRADFIPVGSPTIPFATGTDQKAVYFVQDPSQIGVNQLQTLSMGSTLDLVNSKLYVHNGNAATHQYYVYSLSASLIYVTRNVTIDAATDIVTDAGHTFSEGGPVTFTSLTGGTPLTAGTVYFIRNVVPGVSYQLSATTGGAPINVTVNGTGAIGRAFGTTGSAFLYKTGNLPALTGVLLGTDSEDRATPQHTSNAGQDCVFFCTTTAMYMGRISELTSGATTWPSLITANMLGSVNQITTPTAQQCSWSNVLDKAIITTNGSIFIMKSMVNNSIDRVFGGIGNQYNEGVSGNNTVPLQSQGLIVGMDISSGYMAMIPTQSPAGQRGVIIADLRSDALFDYSYIVTKVLDTPSATYDFIATLDQLLEYTGSLSIDYRTSGFGSISGGWAPISFSEAINIASANQIQFKIRFDTLGLDTSIPAQLSEMILGLTSLNEISDNWEFSFDDSSNGNPSRITFRLKKVYGGAIPNLFFRAYDTSNVLVASQDTATNPSFFEVSHDSGLNWAPVSAISNTVGELLRYTFVTPPGVDVRPSIRES